MRVGLDSVELILRAEELFSVAVSDEEAAQVGTVGDFYILICAKLDVRPLESPVTPRELPIITEREKLFFFLSRHKPLSVPPGALPWSPQSIWDCLIAIFADQLSLNPEKIKYGSEIARDLGVD